MKTRVIMDRTGRITILKQLRKELHLEPGDALEIKSSDGQITLRPVRGTAPLTKEHDVWVLHTGQHLPASATDEALRQVREERDVANHGKDE